MGLSVHIRLVYTRTYILIQFYILITSALVLLLCKIKNMQVKF
jgi:hypothetical protein